MLRLLVAFYLAAVSAVLCAAQTVGDTAASVEATHGRPPIVRKTSTGEIWVYSTGARITFREGRVTALEGVVTDAAAYVPSENISIVPEAPRPASSRVAATDEIDEGPEMPTWANALTIVLGIVVFGAQVVILIKAFKAHILWGLGSLFVPFVSLAFVICHWSDVKRPFLVSLVGSLGIVAVVVFGTISSLSA